MYVPFWVLLYFVVLCTVCVSMCTVLLLPGVNPIAINKYISYHIIYHIISYHIIPYHIMSRHIMSYQGCPNRRTFTAALSEATWERAASQWSKTAVIYVLVSFIFCLSTYNGRVSVSFESCCLESLLNPRSRSVCCLNIRSTVFSE